MVGHVSCEYDGYGQKNRISVVKSAKITPEYPNSPYGKAGHWLKQEIREVRNRLFCAVISPIICSKSWSTPEMKPLSSQKWSHISEHTVTRLQQVTHFCCILCVFSTAVSWHSHRFTLLMAVNAAKMTWQLLWNLKNQWCHSASFSYKCVHCPPLPHESVRIDYPGTLHRGLFDL